LKKYIEVILKKPDEDGFSNLSKTIKNGKFGKFYKK
jgi:hypothetical protein